MSQIFHGILVGIIIVVFWNFDDIGESLLKRKLHNHQHEHNVEHEHRLLNEPFEVILKEKR